MTIWKGKHNICFYRRPLFEREGNILTVLFAHEKVTISFNFKQDVVKYKKKTFSKLNVS